MTQTPAPMPPSGGAMRAHRGAMILVFGILGIVLCVIFGIVAWVMGNNDLREMQAGRMDPAGEGLTVAGKVCGIVSVVLALIGVIIAILWIVLIVIIGVGAAAAGA